jgi:hypothetical protein
MKKMRREEKKCKKDCLRKLTFQNVFSQNLQCANINLGVLKTLSEVGIGVF